MAQIAGIPFFPNTIYSLQGTLKEYNREYTGNSLFALQGTKLPDLQGTQLPIWSAEKLSSSYTVDNLVVKTIRAYPYFLWYLALINLLRHAGCIHEL